MRIPKAIGTLAFYISIPVLFVYLQLRVRTRIIVRHEGRVLLLKSWYGSNKWTLPGGGVNFREKPIDGAVRELYEETGISVKPSQLKYLDQGSIIDGYSLRYRYVLYELSLGKTSDLNIPNHEISDYFWADISHQSNYKKTSSHSVTRLLSVWNKRRNLL